MQYCLISAHICERNAVMGKPSAMYCIHYHYLQYFSVSRPDSLPVHLTPVVGRTSQIREMLLCNLGNVRHTPCYTSFLQRIQAKAR